MGARVNIRYLDPRLVVTDFEPPQRYPWMDEANCLGVDPEIFFQDVNEVTAPGKKYCEPCPVVNDCLIHALVQENPNVTRYSVRGNTGPAERDHIYRSLRSKQ